MCMDTKQVFTTGEVADLLHIHQTTVIDWIEKGHMGRYRTPGGHRRIQKEQLLVFLQEHKMPIPTAVFPKKGEGATEKHRHLHESFQVNPYSTAKPMDAFPGIAKRPSAVSKKRKVKLVKPRGKR